MRSTGRDSGEDHSLQVGDPVVLDKGPAQDGASKAAPAVLPCPGEAIRGGGTQWDLNGMNVRVFLCPREEQPPQSRFAPHGPICPHSQISPHNHKLGLQGGVSKRPTSCHKTKE